MRDILEILLSIPTVDLNITDSDGRNIAQIAVEKDDIEEYDLQCLELLANDPRVNWNIKNADGETPIMYTMRERKEEVERKSFPPRVAISQDAKKNFT